MEAFDALVFAKVIADRGAARASVVAADWGLDASRIDRAYARLRRAGLVSTHGVDLGRALEFFEHALKFIEPARTGAVGTLGVPTGADVPPFDSILSPSDQPWVWPDAKRGTVVGRALEPLVPEVTELVERDPILHLVLACADCFRVGRARERAAARDVLGALLREFEIRVESESA